MKHLHQLTIALIFLSFSAIAYSSNQVADDNDYILIKGRILDQDDKTPLVFASIALDGTNLATVSNSEGRFSIKIPSKDRHRSLKISFLGYISLLVPIDELKEDKNNSLRMAPYVVNLNTLDVFPNDPQIIINNVLKNIPQNYQQEAQLYTAFYRETIQKRRQYVALAESVLEINKPGALSPRSEQIRMLKGRKGVNVSKMDTILFKLQGGAYSMMSMDIIKYPYELLTPEAQEQYDYKFENITLINDEPHLILSFKPKGHIQLPLYYGKFYIHARTMAIASARFQLNTSNPAMASKIFIKKKPMGCKVYPEYASYWVNYRQVDDRWYYSYARGEVKFNIVWEKKLFRSQYTTSSELAVTDRKALESKTFKNNERLRKTAIMHEEVAGFYDEDFWGEYNLIEPEKSIRTAIKKIAKNIEKLE